MAKKNLLLVDADSKSLRMLEVSLRKSGFSVTTAVSATDARDKVRHSQPDLIITDTKLPGDENGFELVANLKAAPETQGIPIIFLSSENKLEQKVTGLELGVEDYLTKPIYIREVLTRVRVLLEKREKEKLERRERSSSFSGSLGEMGLVDLMQTVEIGRKTGRLHVETRGQKGVISFREGKVCDARTGRLTGERAFYRMLVWNEGVFSMEFGPHDGADVIELSTQGLLMEGMRRVDEWGRLLEQLPPLDRVFEIDFGELADRLAEIPDEINAILRLFDGHRRLIDVVDESDFGDLEALEICSKLFFEGLIFDVTDRPPEDNEPAPQQVQRIEQWLDAGGAGEGLLGSPDVDLNSARLEPTQPPTMATVDPFDADVGFSSPLAPPSFAGPPADGLGPPTYTPPAMPAISPYAPPPHERTPPLATALASLPSSPPLTTNSTPALSADEASRLPGFFPQTALPATAASSASLVAAGAPSSVTGPASLSGESGAPRPLPPPDVEVPEQRSVAPRTAVGATTWSSPPRGRGGDDEAWEDIAAGDVGLDDDDLGLSDEQGKRDPSEAPSGIAGGGFEPPAPDDIDLGAQIAAALPPELASEATSGFDDEPSAASTPDDRKSRPPDTIPERAAPGPRESTPPRASQAPGTVVDIVQASAPFTSAPPTSLPQTAASDAPTRPSMPAVSPSLPPQAVTESEKPAAASAQASAAPSEPPSTSSTSSIPASASGASEAPSGERAQPPSPTPHTELPARTERIHTQRTEIDIEPAPSSSAFGVSPVVAGALLGIAIVIGAGFALLFGGGETSAADAGLVVSGDPSRDPTRDPVRDPVADADAGFALEAADAGAPPVVDAGRAVAVVPVAAPDAGPPRAQPDAGVALEKTPDEQYAEHLKLAEALSRRGEFAKSVREYKAALALKPKSVQAHLGLGNAYYELDTLDAALNHLERARALAPRDPQAYVLLGACYQSSGRREDAIEAYKRYLEIAPDGKFARDVNGILKGLGAL